MKRFIQRLLTRWVMRAGDGTESISDDELLYRRIPASIGWYEPQRKRLSAEAFAPHKTRDETGLSVFRAKYKAIEKAALGQPGKSYYVAVLSARDLKAAGIEVAPRPLPNDPGHAELPQLNSTSRKLPKRSNANVCSPKSCVCVSKVLLARDAIPGVSKMAFYRF